MKTFLSIGSGPGMGLATAERFAREGFQVVLSARKSDKAKELAAQLKTKGYKADVRTVEAGDPESVAALVADVESAFGGIDVLHYNAASMRNQNLSDQPRDTFNSDLAVNVGGALVAAQAAAPKMLERGSGAILITGGGFGAHPHPDYLSLSVGKAGNLATAKGIFEPFKEKGVHVATVSVNGFVTTNEDAQGVAECFWKLYSQPAGSWEVEAPYTPKG